MQRADPPPTVSMVCKSGVAILLKVEMVVSCSNVNALRAEADITMMGVPLRLFTSSILPAKWVTCSNDISTMILPEAVSLETTFCRSFGSLIDSRQMTATCVPTAIITLVW